MNQPKATQIAKQQVIAEKLDEATEGGFDGAWVVHPMLVETAKKCFKTVIMSSPNQKHKLPPLVDNRNFSDWVIPFQNSKIGENLDMIVEKADVKRSVRVCLVYYFHWLKGIGAVSFDNLMEVASTVEICRVQLWVWLHQRARIPSKERNLDLDLLDKFIEKESGKISTHDKLTLLQAKSLLKSLLKQTQMSESFLELAYPILDKH